MYSNGRITFILVLFFSLIFQVSVIPVFFSVKAYPDLLQFLFIYMILKGRFSFFTIFLSVSLCREIFSSVPFGVETFKLLFLYLFLRILFFYLSRKWELNELILICIGTFFFLFLDININRLFGIFSCSDLKLIFSNVCFNAFFYIVSDRICTKLFFSSQRQYELFYS